MSLVMGIDGGGSTVRVVITDATLAARGQATGPTANPSAAGRARAAEVIQTAMRAALAAAGCEAEQIAAVGIGVAGAAATHAADWLRQTVAGVLPGALIVPSSDYEIALTGGRGAREGVLVLAGTGSLVYGVNAAGEARLVGGWGYLLGDQGSGYWLGLHGLRVVIAAAEGLGPQTALSEALLAALKLETPRALIPWLYRRDAPPIREVAALAPLVLDAARAGDEMAVAIVTGGAAYLAAACKAVQQQLGLAMTQLVCTGSLLTTPNPLSEQLRQALALPDLPLPLHPPVIGAALLALDALHT